MLTSTMRACAVAPGRVACGRRAGAALHQARPAAPSQLRVARRAGAVAVRASSGPEPREQAAEAVAGLTPAGLSMVSALLASPLLFDAQARAAPAHGQCCTATHASAAAPCTPRPAFPIKRAAAESADSAPPRAPVRAQDALAAGGAYGILEGRTGALVHPAIMFFLFAATGFTGFLGWQWRRVRTIPDEVAELKTQLPQAPAGGASARAPKPRNAARMLHTRAYRAASRGAPRTRRERIAQRIQRPSFTRVRRPACGVLTRFPSAPRHLPCLRSGRRGSRAHRRAAGGADED
jgi:hypothetical protein